MFCIIPFFRYIFVLDNKRYVNRQSKNIIMKTLFETFCSSSRGLFVLPFFLISFYAMNAQEKTVKKTILEKDSIFWKAYNECDIATMEKYLSSDLEFYHDTNGFLQGSQNLVESLNKGLCKTGKNTLRREALPKTVAVFPLEDKDSVYGAIITGEHVFYKSGDPAEKVEGKASFFHLWLLKDGKWKMHRVFSYDHLPPSYVSQKTKISVSPTQLKQFEGKYLMPSKDIIIVKALKDRLELEAMGKTFVLFPESRYRFFTKERDLTFSFTKEMPQKVTIFEGDNKVAEATISEK